MNLIGNKLLSFKGNGFLKSKFVGDGKFLIGYLKKLGTHTTLSYLDFLCNKCLFNSLHNYEIQLNHSHLKFIF